ncbi:hypothetical protein NW752_008527 [Fusarium irregulare]|uniref:Uncharacterized protein n=1 Tax=Fusarium irregulare TaxID=2494466 RepID=A0A9W8PWJ4_9HYPO|nr:hypothetical protein NW752_008527 [Fusarium irregulare]KAJ4020457.1 hypothetical protein NW766_001943 [Fusarium irregulare]
MSGDSGKAEQQPEVKDATTSTTHGLDQYADLIIRTPGGGYSCATDDTAVIREIFRRIERETGATAVTFRVMPVTKADSKAFKKKAVEQRMIGNLGFIVGNGKKEGPDEDQSLEPKANVNANTKNE